MDHDANKQRAGVQKQRTNPISRVGKGLHAGVNTLQGVPQQAVGHMMGGASGGHHSQRQFREQATADGAAGNSPSRQGQGGAQSPNRKRRHAAAVKRNHNAAMAAADDNKDNQQSGRSEENAAASHGSDDSLGQASDSANLKGWDKVRKVVKGTQMTKSSPNSQGTSASLESSSPLPEGNPESRKLKRSSTADGSLSRNTRGPMQYIWSRGGKMAAVLAMMGSRGNKSQPKPEGDIEGGKESHGNDACDITSNGADNAPGDDPVSKYGAKSPGQAAGTQVSTQALRTKP